MTQTNESALRKFGGWLFEQDENPLYERAAISVLDNIFTGAKYIGVAIWEWFIPVLPDLIGFGAVGAGAFVILSAMTGRGVVKPLAVFSGATILAACILEAN